MQDLVKQLTALMERRKQTLVTAESCTGGLLASVITARPSASTNFERGFVTYSNESKIEILGVPANIIEKHGAVSAETALAMAQGALKNSRADVAISITGIAGPDGGSEDKPIGLVYFGYAAKTGENGAFKKNFTGSRTEVRESAARAALEYLIGKLN